MHHPVHYSRSFKAYFVCVVFVDRMRMLLDYYLQEFVDMSEKYYA